LSQALVQLRDAFLNVRYFLREIGNQAQVDIEPSSQEELLNATMEIPGVLIAGVPGGKVLLYID
jgi:phosphomevalonate kinase